MELESIRFFGYPADKLPCIFNIQFESGEDLKEIRERTRLGALVLKNSDLELLREFDTAISDRGRKHPAKGLRAHLLNNKKPIRDVKMPLIRCEYLELSRMKSSIRKLLTRAAEKGERNTYIIGVQPVRFKELKSEINSPHECTSKGETTNKGELSWPEEALKLLSTEKVPKEVSSRYIGTSKDVQLVHQLILRAARLDYPVLIVGESGTGKELVAWSIHEQSDRRTGPFRVVNCGAIPSELFESELFGTRKNAFTDAMDKEGLWTQAHGGTLFLDEIGDLAINHQVKILRAMQEGSVRRVGDLEDKPVDARIITATNRNLASMVQTGQFREDLYYRIHGFVIYTPPLRSHPEDIPQMAMKFWADITKDSTKTLSSDILTELKSRRWQGNGRELKMFLSSLYGLFGDQKITLQHLRVVEGHPGLSSPQGDNALTSQKQSLRRMDQLRHLQRILEVLSSLKASLRPLLVENNIDLRTTTLIRVVLLGYVAKLESLGSQAELSGSNVSRKSVMALGDALQDFSQILETNANRARDFWQKGVQPLYQDADSNCFTEIQRLLDEVKK
jgi:transcriptional regulator with PAS, ATPase and Fis domain